jgi:ankyrin repeat protein
VLHDLSSNRIYSVIGGAGHRWNSPKRTCAKYVFAKNTIYVKRIADTIMLGHLSPSGVTCNICYKDDFAPVDVNPTLYEAVLENSEMVLFCHERKHFMCAECAQTWIVRAATRTSENFQFKDEPKCPWCRSDLDFGKIFAELCTRVVNHGQQTHADEDPTQSYTSQNMMQLMQTLTHNRHLLLYALIATNAYQFLPMETIKTFAQKQYDDDGFLMYEDDGESWIYASYRTADNANDDSEPEEWGEPANAASAAMMKAFLDKNPTIMRFLCHNFRFLQPLIQLDEGTTIVLGLADAFKMFCNKTNDGRLHILQELLIDFKFDYDDNNSENLFTLLHYASKQGYVDVVWELLKVHGAIENPQDIYDLEPVHYAIQWGYGGIACLLFDQYRKPIRQAKNGKSFAEVAAHYGQTEMLHTFAQEGYIDMSLGGKECLEALEAAVEGGHLGTVQTLVNDYQVMAAYKPTDGPSVVHKAAIIGNVDLIRFLVMECVLDVNIPDQIGETPLHLAVQNENLAAVRVLVDELKADVMPVISVEPGMQPLHLAAQSSDPDILRLLVRSNADVNALSAEMKTPLYYACMSWSAINVVALVQEFGVDANAKCDVKPFDVAFGCMEEHVRIRYLDIPLSIGAESGGLAVVKALIEKCKVQPDLENTMKALRRSFDLETSIYLINQLEIDLNWFGLCEHFNEKNTLFCQILPYPYCDAWASALVQRCGADPNARDSKGETALMFATRKNEQDLARELLQQCAADPHVTNLRGNQAIHVAAWIGNEAMIHLLLKHTNVDVNVVNAGGDTILHLMAKRGHVGELEKLIDTYDVDVDLGNKQGDTILHLLMSHCDDEDVDWIRCLIVEKNATRDVKNKNGDTILHAAALHGNWKACDYLLGPTLVYPKFELWCKNNQGERPLHAAAKGKKPGSVATVIHLCQTHKANPEAQDNAGRTPLMVASVHRNNDIVKALVYSCNAKVHATDHQGWTALFYAAHNGNVSTVIELLDNCAANDPSHAGLAHQSKNGQTAIFVAAANGQTNAVMVLLEHGKNPGQLDITQLGLNDVDDSSDDEDNRNEERLNQPVSPTPARARANAATPSSLGCTPLWAAASNGHINTVRILVRKFGVEVATPNYDGETALHAAAKGGHVDMVSVLLREFAMDVNARSNTGQTPLHYAAQNHHYHLVLSLLSLHGANVNAVDNSGQTILFYNLDPQHMDTLVSIFDINTEIENAQGYTALQQCVMDENILQVQGLISKCFAEVNVFNVKTYSPLSLAIMRNNMEIAQLLLDQSNADVNLESSEQGVSPLHLAAQHGGTEMLRLLVHAGAETQCRDIHKNTPMFYAVRNTRNAQGDVLEYLLGLRDVDVNTRNQAGETAILVAVKQGTLQALNILCEHGADLGLTYENGETLRDYAARRGWEYLNAVKRAFEIQRVSQHNGLPLETMKMLGQFRN